MTSTLPLKKALSPGHNPWETTPCGRTGDAEGVAAPSAIDVAERARARCAASTTRDASRAASLANLMSHQGDVGVPRAGVLPLVHRRTLAWPPLYKKPSPVGV